MRATVRSAAPRFIAASMAALALSVGLGIGAVAATAATTSGVRPCGWHKLALVNGWHSQQSKWDSGDPAYCIPGDGMVYLSGSLAQSSGTDPEFAVLPRSGRPAS